MYEMLLIALLPPSAIHILPLGSTLMDFYLSFRCNQFVDRCKYTLALVDMSGFQ